MAEENPKLFVSYSWSSPEHEQWVIDLASGLCESGIDVILDKWDLREGHDANAFMEKMVSDPDVKKVVIICDRTYKEKADERSGGVGTETQIISAEVYSKQDQNKFVAVIAEKDDDGKPYLPIYYKSRIYIDLSDDDLYAKNLEQLLRWIYDKPLNQKPSIGKMPSFLSDETAPNLGTSFSFKRALDAIRNNKNYSKGALSEYFNTFIGNFERFRITLHEGDFDDAVVKNIEEFIPYRNEAIEIFAAIAQYHNTPETHQLLHRFFESMIPFMYRPKHISGYREWDWDNFRFFIHELFLYAIAIFLKHECFDAVAYMVRHRYYLISSLSKGEMQSFAEIHQYTDSLEYRDKRLKGRRLSLRADLLEQRSKLSGLSFNSLMQADFILYMRDCIDCLRNSISQSWWPETLLYIDIYQTTFEIFHRAESNEYFNRIKSIFDISEKVDLEQLCKAFTEGHLTIPRWEFHTFNPINLMRYDQLATRP